MTRLSRLPVALSLALAGVVGCGGDAPPAPVVTVQPPPKVVYVVVIVDSTLMTQGSASAARAIGFDDKGFPIPGRTPTWSGDASGILSVSPAGVVRAVRPGLGKVFASIEGVSGEAQVAVIASPVVALVSVYLSRLLLAVGDTATAAVSAIDSIGTPIRDRQTVWSIESDSNVATVSNRGMVTAVGPGSARLVAVVDSVRGTFDFSVAPRPTTGGKVSVVLIALASLTLRVGDTATATMRAYDSLGVEVIQRPVVWSLTGNPAVATISNAGRITAVTPGNAAVVATVDGVPGQLGFTVVDSLSGGPVGSLPALPETLSFAYPRVTGRQWLLKAGDNLQTTLNSAQRGDEIVLPAGVTFTGNFVLPAKNGGPGDGWIIIRSDKADQLPPLGTRVSAAHAALMPKVVTANTAAALATNIYASGWWISGIEFSIAPSVTAVQNGIVEMGIGGPPQNELSKVPTDIVLDRVYIHAQPNQPTSRCLELHSARTVVADSYLVECHGKGFDSQAIVAWNGPGPYKIVNNTLVGAGENVMFGGADPTIRDLIPSDIEFRRNYVFTPPSWFGPWTKKNLFETKNVRRLLIEGNIFDGSWSDGQSGWAVVMKSANQSGRCTWCASRDITIRYNIFRNSGSGFQLSGKEGSNPYPVGQLMNNLLIEHNVIENINVGPFKGDGTMFQILVNPSNIIIRNNTATTTGSQKNLITVENKPSVTNLELSQNIFTLGRYGIFSSVFGSGEVALGAVGGQLTVSRNVIIGPFKTGYPNASFVGTMAEAVATGLGPNLLRINQLTANIVIP